jgi:hypothetical protein
MQHTGKVPSNDDPAVLRFLKKWSIQEKPVRLQFADYGYDPAQCHVSAKHKALSDGGRRVHGWALWMFDGLLLAEHHSVWEDHNGDLVDVTPPSNGGMEIVFVRDDTARIILADGDIELFTQRTADERCHWFWNGECSEYSNWPCPQNKADLVAYCAKWNFAVLDILTDDEKG